MWLNHSLGDGFTFFELLAMLDEAAPVRPLDARRRFGFARKAAEHVGREHYNWPRGGRDLGFSSRVFIDFRGFS